jgi:hypothetical protein
VEAFPFTEAEWAADPVLRASLLVGLLDVLAELRARHGDHPVLLEAQADFTDDDGERVALYRRAVRVALTHGLPTLSIRLSLARVLLGAGQPAAARVELRACAGEAHLGDEAERSEWAELLAESGGAEPAAAPDRPAPGAS